MPTPKIVDPVYYDPKYDKYRRELETRNKLDDILSLTDLGSDIGQTAKVLLGIGKKNPIASSVLLGISLGNDLKQSYLKYKLKQD